MTMAALMPEWIREVLNAFVGELHSAPVTLILALLAILFAVIQFFDSLHVKRKMRGVIQKEDELVSKTESVTKSILEVSGRITTVTKSIEAVDRSLSTRFVGAFHKHIKPITEVVGRTDHYFLVLTDWVSYGEYSMPQEYEEYKRRVRNIRLNKPGPPRVCILAYDEDRLKEQLAEQFPEEDFVHESTKDRFTQYFERYHPSKPVPKTYEEFTKTALEIEKEQRKELTDIGVEIQSINRSSLVFLWLEDGEDAVFSFQTQGGAQQGLSFRTRDIGLISSLYYLFTKSWKGSPIPRLPHELPLTAKAVPSAKA